MGFFNALATRICGKDEIRVRGDPTFEVGDIIGVDDPTDKIENLDLQIIQQVLEYDGGLKVTLKGRKTLSEHEWVFLMPWQPVYAEKTKPEKIETYFLLPWQIIKEVKV